mmetsp:Transcript_3000/g.10775  ORF Transcript_3000/g.10775 Transcript_3000/m.10775 type:complete len:223 (-) Transcript_3000:1038-1706(-)
MLVKWAARGARASCGAKPRMQVDTLANPVPGSPSLTKSGSTPAPRSASVRRSPQPLPIMAVAPLTNHQTATRNATHGSATVTAASASDPHEHGSVPESGQHPKRLANVSRSDGMCLHASRNDAGVSSSAPARDVAASRSVESLFVSSLTCARNAAARTGHAIDASASACVRWSSRFAVQLGQLPPMTSTRSSSVNVTALSSHAASGDGGSVNDGVKCRRAVV